MIQRKRTTGWPEGFEAYIRERRFTDVEELLLWDCASMVECWEEALARWMERQGWVRQVEMCQEEWKAVRELAKKLDYQFMKSRF